MKTNIFKWVLGGLGVAVIYDILFNDAVFKSIKNPIPEPKMLGKYEFGITIVNVTYDFESVNDSGKWKVKLKKFIVTSTIYIHADLSVFKRIEDFAIYYKPNRDYVYSDYKSGFTTREAVIFHEEKHQEEIESKLNEYKATIIRVVNAGSSDNKEDADKKARQYLDYMKQRFEGYTDDAFMKSDEAEETHKAIRLEQWKFMHDQYVKWRRK